MEAVWSDFLGESAQSLFLSSGLLPLSCSRPSHCSHLMALMDFTVRVLSSIKKLFCAVYSLLDVETDVTHVWFKSKQALLVPH